MARMTAKVQDLGATSRANEAATVVGKKIGSLAGVIRENAPREAR
jgi:hypothetical protein